MTAKNIFFFISSLALVLIVTLVAIFSVQKKQVEESSVPLVTSYINSENVAVDIAVFEDETKYFSGLGYVQLPMVATTSASGARMIDTSGEIEVWNKGSELTVSYRGDVVFVGSSAGKLVTDDRAGQLSVPTVDEVLSSYTWRWQPPTVADEKIDGYTVAFNNGILAGTTPCGTFTGTYELVAPELLVTIEESTLPTCVDTNTNTMSEEFIEILKAVATVAVTETLDIIITTDNPTAEHRLSIQLDELL